MAKWFLIILTIQLELLISHGLINNNYNCTSSPCIIDCTNNYCQNLNVFCPDSSHCEIDSKQSNITNLTMYCGNNSICNVNCNNYMGTVRNVTIFGPNANNISIAVYQYAQSVADDITIMANYVNNITFLCYGNYASLPPASVALCNNVNIEASFANTLHINCDRPDDYDNRNVSCNNFNINATNVSNLFIESYLNYTNSLIDASNVSSVTYKFPGSYYDFYHYCTNLILFCGIIECNVYGACDNITLYQSERSSLYNLKQMDLRNSKIYAHYAKQFRISCLNQSNGYGDCQNNIIYVNYAQNVHITGALSGNIIYANNSQQFYYYVIRDGDHNNYPNRIHVANSSKVTYSKQFEYADYLYAQNVSILNVICNDTKNWEPSCANLFIHAEFANSFNLVCYSGTSDYGICDEMSIYATNADNISIKAYGNSAFRLNNVYASNANFIDIECMSNQVYHRYCTCCANKWHLTNATQINFQCLGTSACGVLQYSPPTTISAWNAQNIYFYAVGKDALYSYDGGMPGAFILNATNAANVRIVFDNGSNTMYEPGSPSNQINIWVSSSKITNTIIYCAGVNSCLSAFQLNSPNGLADINVISTPECECGSFQNISNDVDYGCLVLDQFDNTDGKYSMVIYCDVHSDHGQHQSYFPTKTVTEPYPLCNSECCKGSQFYGSCSSNHSKSIWDKYKYYFIACFTLFCIFLIILCLTCYWKMFKGLKHKNTDNGLLQDQ